MSGLPVGLYAQGAGGNALAAAIEAARAGADVIATSVYPVALTMHRVSAEAAAQALAGLGLATGVDMDALWAAADLVDEHIGDEPVVAGRAADRGARGAAQAPRRARRRRSIRSCAPRRPATGSTRCSRRSTRCATEVGSPPLAAPIGKIVASQALLNVLTANRYSTMVDELRDLVEGRFGRTPARGRSGARARGRADRQRRARRIRRSTSTSSATEAEGLASSEEELLLLALFGEEAEPLLRSIRERSGGDESLGARGVDQARAEQIREVVRIVQETGVGEITIEEDGMRVSVRRTAEQPHAPAPAAPVAPGGEAGAAAAPTARRLARAGREPDGRDVLPRALHRAPRRSSRKATPSRRGRRSASSRR